MTKIATKIAPLSDGGSRFTREVGMADKVEHVLDDGITYELKLAANPTPNNGGYMGVVQQGNLYYAKITLAKGAGQMVIPGGGCSTPREAALRIAKYWASPYPIHKKAPERAPKGAAKVRRRACPLP